jgi:copper chaperone CopZ
MKIDKFGVMGLVFFLIFFAGVMEASAAESDQGSVHQATLKIDGMSCGSCVGTVRSALLKAPGVKAAEVKVKKKWLFFNDFSDVRATVEYEEDKTTVDDLIKTVKGASDAMSPYRASLLN